MGAHSLQLGLRNEASLLPVKRLRDPGISPLNSIDYYKSVRTRLGPGKADASYRLFMMPGMGHCRGGEGPDTIDALASIEQWVERKQAPDRIIASRIRNGKPDRTRPLCPYPQVAVYSGKGGTDEASNFSCAVK
jgi:feruloyl esterase